MSDWPSTEEIKQARDEAIGLVVLSADLVGIAKGRQPQGSFGLTAEECANRACRMLELLLDGLRDRGEIFDRVRNAIPPMRPAVTVGTRSGYTFHRAVFHFALEFDILSWQASSQAFFDKSDDRSTAATWPHFAEVLKTWPDVDTEFVTESLRAESQLALWPSNEKTSDEDEPIYLGEGRFRVGRETLRVTESDLKFVDHWAQLGHAHTSDFKDVTNNASEHAAKIKKNYPLLAPFIELPNKERNKGYRLRARVLPGKSNY